MKACKNQMVKSLSILVVVVSLLLSLLVNAFADETSSVVGVWKGTGTMDDINVGITVTFTDKQFTVDSNHYNLQGDYTIKDKTVTLTALGFSIPMVLESTDPRTLSGSIKFEDYTATMSLTESLDVATDSPTTTADPNKKSGDLNDLLAWLVTLK